MLANSHVRKAKQLRNAREEKSEQRELARRNSSASQAGAFLPNGNVVKGASSSEIRAAHSDRIVNLASGPLRYQNDILQLSETLAKLGKVSYADEKEVISRSIDSLILVRSSKKSERRCKHRTLALHSVWAR